MGLRQMMLRPRSHRIPAAPWLVLSFLAFCVAPAAAAPDSARPALFLGNDSLPPLNFLENGAPQGLVVDLVRAAARFMSRVVEIRLMNWSEAQQMVRDGKADALMQINPTQERRAVLDFSEPLLESEFSIFADNERVGIDSLEDLHGHSVGVEQQGLPMLLVQDNPRITRVPLPDLSAGFRMLSAGAVDAVIADRRVGTYLLAGGIAPGIRAMGPPVQTSRSAIAVAKGNSALLADINHGLEQIRDNGTYDRIVRSWTPQEVVYVTRGQEQRRRALLAGVVAAFVAAVAGIVLLLREMRRRRRTEKELGRVVQQLRSSLAEIKTLRGILPICAHCKKIRDDKGYWTQVESYVSQRTEAEFTHGLCPDCVKTLYPDLVTPEEEG
jgi:ABC-type amino acid transport substrate-binding protein